MTSTPATYDVIPPAGLDVLTPGFDLLCEVLGLGASFKARIVRDLDLAAPMRVLDVGCGTGVLATRIKLRCPAVEVAGLDPTPSALAIARARAAGRGLSIDWYEGLAEQLPFPDASFDRVVSSLAFHHIPPHVKSPALRECLRVTRPGGRILIADFCEADTWYLKAYLAVAGRFEHFRDQVGRMGSLLRDAGFTDVERLHGNRLGIASYQGIRP